MNLRYDVPDDADGPEYALRIAFSEQQFRFFVADLSEAAREADGNPEWTDLGTWRETSLWMARQLAALGSPVGYGVVRLGRRRRGLRSRAVRDLTDDETLQILNDPPDDLV